MSDLVSSFGFTLRRFREERGWSQEELAARADLNRSYLGEIERGQVIASLATIGKLSRAFGITPAVIFEHCEHAFPSLLQASDSTIDGYSRLNSPQS